VIVGQNMFTEEDMEDHADEYQHIDEDMDARQKERLAQVKAQRDAGAVQTALQQLAAAIDRDENLMPSIIEAVKCYASIGEVCNVMRGKWGEYTPPDDF
jgi:methylmalonyl-CoA mutase N-terminal domain/subunit